MLYYRRRLPHCIPDHATVFVTWRLSGSMPPASSGVLTVEKTGRASFRMRDERLDGSACGPIWLREPRIATIIEDALLYGEATRSFYLLHACVIMPNHVHVVFEPHIALPTIMRWLKGERVARRTSIWGERECLFGRMNRTIIGFVLPTNFTRSLLMSRTIQ
jgi:hypothetical protein